MKNKYEELDKQVSKIIMKEFEGKSIEHDCPYCGGLGHFLGLMIGEVSMIPSLRKDKITRERINKDAICENCEGYGTITIEY